MNLYDLHCMPRGAFKERGSVLS